MPVTLSKNGKRVGRPEVPYDPEVGDRICTILSTTTRGLEQALEEVNLDREAGQPPISLISVYRWLDRDEGFRNQYAQARERQADVLHDFAQREAEKERPAITKRKGKRGGKDFEEVGASDNVMRSRLIVDTIKWRAGQLNPKKYGEGKNSGDSDNPVKIQVEIVGISQGGKQLKPPPEFVNGEVKQLPSGD